MKSIFNEDKAKKIDLPNAYKGNIDNDNKKNLSKSFILNNEIYN